jgi:hypothetical protein
MLMTKMKKISPSPARKMGGGLSPSKEKAKIDYRVGKLAHGNGIDSCSDWEIFLMRGKFNWWEAVRKNRNAFSALFGQGWRKQEVSRFYQDSYPRWKVGRPVLMGLRQCAASLSGPVRSGPVETPSSAS